MFQSIFTFQVTSNLILLSFAAYFSWRFVWPLSLNGASKILLLLIIFGLACHATVFEALSIAAPDSILIVTSWGLIVIVFAALLAFLADGFSLLLRLLGVRPAETYLLSTKFLPAILLATGLFSTYGMYQALRVPPIKNITIHFAQLPSDLAGIRIAHIADPHIGKFFRYPWLDSAVDSILTAQPDIICITGDAVDAPFAAIKNDVLPFSRLKAPLGVYFVAGNHEYLNNYSDWLEYFNSLPQITLLENAHKNLKIGNSTLSVIGLTDRAAQRFDLPLPNAQIALAGLEEKNFRPLLSHRPGEVENAAIEADLQLSGHTHGGILWFLKGILAKNNDGYVSGLYDSPADAQNKIFVSNGMAVWDGFPFRLGVDSEITIITLAAK